jgi:DNA-binding NtrC family response regulator
MGTILVIAANLEVYAQVVGCAERRHAIFSAETYRRVMKHLRTTHFDLVLLDDELTATDALHLLDRIKKVPECPPVVYMTSAKDSASKTKAVRRGAAECLAKPFTCEQLLNVVGKHTGESSPERVEEPVVEVQSCSFDVPVIAESPAMKSLLELARAAAQNSQPVLIEGEPGTGKETLARFIHAHQTAGTAPFVVVNCETSAREPLASAACSKSSTGTIFLDEVAALDSHAQAKLLSCIQKLTEGGVRIIAATTENLQERIGRKSFNEELYWSLAGVLLRVPPLRYRKADILPLAYYYIQGYVRQSGRNELVLPDDAKQALLSAQWTGNVRELQNVVQRIVLFSPPEAREVSVPILQDSFQTKMKQVVMSAVSQRWTVDDLEKEYLQNLLSEPDLEMGDICRILQIDQSTLYRKRKRFGL